MDQNMMMFIIVVVALSMVTVALVVMKVPKQFIIYWGIVDAILTGLAVWFFLFYQA